MSGSRKHLISGSIQDPNSQRALSHQELSAQEPITLDTNNQAAGDSKPKEITRKEQIALQREILNRIALQLALQQEIRNRQAFNEQVRIFAEDPTDLRLNVPPAILIVCQNEAVRDAFLEQIRQRKLGPYEASNSRGYEEAFFEAVKVFPKISEEQNKELSRINIKIGEAGKVTEDKLFFLRDFRQFAAAAPEERREKKARAFFNNYSDYETFKPLTEARGFNKFLNFIIDFCSKLGIKKILPRTFNTAISFARSAKAGPENSPDQTLRTKQFI